MATEVQLRRDDKRIGTVDRLLPYVSYPVVMIGGVTLHLLLLELGLPLLASTYITVFLGMATVTWLELRIPHESSWKAKPEDVKADLLYGNAVSCGSRCHAHIRRGPGGEMK